MTHARPTAAATTLTAVLAAALLSLAGCGSTASPSAGSASSSTAGGSSSSTTSASYPTQKKKACDILSEQVATTLVGALNKDFQNSDTTGPNVVVSSCARSNQPASIADLKNIKSVSLLARIATNKDGATENAKAFEGNHTAGSQDVTGYGEKAYWSPKFGQLNVLSKGNWYILGYGPMKMTARTLDETKKLADAIKADL